MAEITATNPYGLCNFDPEADCAACPVYERVFCHYDLKDTLLFLALILPAFVAIGAGLLRQGKWQGLLAWIGALFFFLQVPENYILCRHCPYYAEGGRRTLLCQANAGLLKLWTFNPKPMAWWEKAGFLGGALALMAVPTADNLLNGETVAGVAGILSAAGWVLGMRRWVCKRCPNFSCPLNTVPEAVREAYLRRNSVFAEAWGLDEDKGAVKKA